MDLIDIEPLLLFVAVIPCPALPVTAVTEISMFPVPKLVAKIPCPTLPLTTPLAEIVMCPIPLFVALMPSDDPVTADKVRDIDAPRVDVFRTNIPSLPVPEPVIVPVAVTVILPADTFERSIPFPASDVTVVTLRLILPSPAPSTKIAVADFPNTVPLADIETAPGPVVSTRIPWPEPVTALAVIVRDLGAR